MVRRRRWYMNMKVGAKLLRTSTSSLFDTQIIFSHYRRRTFCTHQQSYKSNPPLPSPPLKNPNFLYNNPKSFTDTPYNYNINLTKLGRDGRVHDARKLFNEMPHRDIVSYVSMITIYIKNNDLFNAESLYHAIPEKNIVADSAMIDAYAKSGRIDEARRIFNQMPYRNVYSWTSLISGHFRNGLVHEAQKLFDQMPGKNIVTYTSVLLGYAHNGLINQARAIFDQTPNKNVVIWTAMIKSYIDNSQIDEAFKLFNTMPQRNLYTYNIMIQGFFNNNKTKEAIDLFTSMPTRNHVSWTTMVTGLSQNNSSKLARKYFNQMPKKDIAAWNAMISSYTNEGLMTEAIELIHTMPERNVVTWNAIIFGYAKLGTKGESFKHLILLLDSHIRPNECTLTSVLTSCENCVDLSQIHSLSIRLGYEHETSLSNSLISMYAKCGDLESSKLVFDNFKKKDIVSWTSMMLAYSTHGFGSKAIEIFARMLRLGFKPDEITFLALLTACSHTGLVEKGLKFFNSMKKVYNVGQKAEHYTCLVDIYCRAGQLEMGLKVVDQMPKEMRDGAVLGALLSGCKLYGDDVIASEIGKKVIEIEPNDSGGYVLMANFYARCGKWEEVRRVRREMNGKVRKVPGFSEVNVKGCNYVFFVGDRNHSEFDEINEMLIDRLLPEMKLRNVCCFMEDLI